MSILGSALTVAVIVCLIIIVFAWRKLRTDADAGDHGDEFFSGQWDGSGADNDEDTDDEMSRLAHVVTRDGGDTQKFLYFDFAPSVSAYERAVEKAMSEHLAAGGDEDIRAMSADRLKSLRLALMMRAIVAVEQAWFVQQYAPGMELAFRRGMLRNDMADRLRLCHEELSSQLEQLKTEAERLQDGWGDSVIGEAINLWKIRNTKVLHEQRRRLDEKKRIEQLKAAQESKERAERERAEAAKREERERKAALRQATIEAERAYNELMREEERKVALAANNKGLKKRKGKGNK